MRLLRVPHPRLCLMDLECDYPCVLNQYQQVQTWRLLNVCVHSTSAILIPL